LTNPNPVEDEIRAGTFNLAEPSIFVVSLAKTILEMTFTSAA
jgi:hypothetical protein